ncbi:MAG: hypothetical protein KAS72_15080 [Phycisphaerales bacterium]|nr:hypothetical protein [Phycisphaerales bacterium]
MTMTQSTAIPDDAKTQTSDETESEPINPGAPLPHLDTPLTVEQIRERLKRANYRGRLPNITWADGSEQRFTFDILGHHFEHDVFASIDTREDEQGCRLRFTVALCRRPIWIMIAVIIISTPIGAYFMDMVPLLNKIPYPWVWFPIANIGLSAWWLVAEIRKTIPKGWSEAVRYIGKLADELDGTVSDA